MPENFNKQLEQKRVPEPPPPPPPPPKKKKKKKRKEKKTSDLDSLSKFTY